MTTNLSDANTYVLPPIFGQALSTVEHKAGGKVLRITGIGHETARPQDGRSQDVWFYLGDVKWFDGSRSLALEISPNHLCNPGPELDALGEALSDYLLAFGEWRDRAARDQSTPQSGKRAGRGSRTPEQQVTRGWLATDRAAPCKRTVRIAD